MDDYLEPDPDLDRGDGSRRPQVSTDASAGSLLLTVLGELVLPTGSTVWTSALVYVLTGLGVENQTARQAIARAAKAGWIEGEKQGREVRWTLTATGMELIEEVTSRVLSLNALPEVWDGNCLILSVTVPQSQKAVRKRLYRALSWAGFGNPAPGVWASPHVERADEMTRIIRDLGLRDSTFAFVGTTISAGLSDREIVERAWNLDDVASRYERVIATFDGVEPEPGDDLLFTHIALVDEWRKFPGMDPQLPEDLLPGWIGRRAVEMFVSLHMKWGEAARDRWREVVELTSTKR
jgi:phenylacetic acid degradation operon negative regulatory protein